MTTETRTFWKAVRPDLTTKHGQKWYPGTTIRADHNLTDSTGPCPSREGDGLCLAKTWAGAASAGWPTLTCYEVTVTADQIIGEDETKVRVKGEITLGDPYDAQALIRAGWCARANLYGANLSRANLSGANLYGANLSRVDLYGANLSRADLSGVDLSGANLSRADLSGVDLSGANLSGANLSRANLSRANLSRVDLSRVDLSRVDLSGADLSRADLSGADLSGALNTDEAIGLVES